MLRPSPELEAFERRYAREVLGKRSYHEALGIFAALWAEASHLNPGFPLPWQADLDADLAIARVLNHLPPNA